MLQNKLMPVSILREKSSLHRGMEKLRNEIIQLRERCEELQDSKTEALKELLEIKGRFQGELNAAQADLIDEASTREGMDRKLSELRTEVRSSLNLKSIEYRPMINGIIVVTY